MPTSISRVPFYILFAGLLWSTGGPLIRLLDSASEWQFLFFRSLALAMSLLLIMKIQDRKIIDLFKKAGVASVLGGLFLSFAFVSFVFSVTHTTIANTLFLLSSAPFVAGLLGWILLAERVNKIQWIAMTVASLGVAVMIQDGISGDSLFGSSAAFVAAASFAGFTVSLRWGKSENMLPAVCYAGLFTTFYSTVAVMFLNEGLLISRNDILIAAGFGTFGLGFGMVLYVTGSYQMQAAELVLLSLLEIILGPIWAWMFFSESPTALTLIGGGILLSAIFIQTSAGLKYYKNIQNVPVKNSYK